MRTSVLVACSRCSRPAYCCNVRCHEAGIASTHNIWGQVPHFPFHQWIDAQDALALHERLLSIHGGAEGLRDLALLETA